MNKDLRKRLIEIAKHKISNEDASHDFAHALRVLSNAERIAKEEGGDPDVIVPAALFHDLVVYQKDHPKTAQSQIESAREAEKILNAVRPFPKRKIKHVKTCIMECSFSKGIVPELLESKIMQDADGLEATGAISIMRTYSSTGQMKRPFYHQDDPFCEHRQPDDTRYALDLFYTRLLKVKDRMYTKTAQRIAKRRTAFLRDFLKEFRRELRGL